MARGCFPEEVSNALVGEAERHDVDVHRPRPGRCERFRQTPQHTLAQALAANETAEVRLHSSARLCERATVVRRRAQGVRASRCG